MPRHVRRRAFVASAAAALTLGLVAPADAAPLTDDGLGGFYDAPASLPGANGALVKSEPANWSLGPLGLLDAGADATRVMYRSSDKDGSPIAVSGTILTPRAAWKGGGTRPVVGYAVGTQGMGDECAPSSALSKGTEYESLFVSGMLAKGWSVALTDYQGLGTAGVHSYMVRAAQGHAVLDSVRAARNLGLGGVTASSPVVISGYSQGGGASASALELAPSYAPELPVKGGYAGAVPADLQAVADLIDGTLYTAFELFAVAGVGTAYGLDPADVLNARGQEVAQQVIDSCVGDGLLSFPFLDTSTLTQSGKKAKDMIREEPFASWVADQRIGVGRRPTVPVMVGHSALDDVIPYAAGRSMAKRWCQQGARVDFDTSLAPTHVGGFVDLYPRALAYLDDRINGRYAVNDCWLL